MIIEFFLGGCPVWNPKYAFINGNCYYYENADLTYNAAIENCKTIFGDAGRLFEPREENTHDQIVAAGKGEVYWIGINDRIVEKDFRYVSGDSLTFQNWASGTYLQY